jgi:hypothetical protein
VVEIRVLKKLSGQKVEEETGDRKLQNSNIIIHYLQELLLGKPNQK